MDLEKLAELARIKLSSEEKESLKKDLPNILAYVDQISDAPIGDPKENEICANNLRSDDETHDSSIYREKILKQFPDKDGDYLKVKKILQ